MWYPNQAVAKGSGCTLKIEQCKKAYANKHQNGFIYGAYIWLRNSFESWKANKRLIRSASGSLAVLIQFIESLILAQDERWRRA